MGSGDGWQTGPAPAAGEFQGLGQPVPQPQTWQYPPIPIPQPPGPGRRRKPRQVSKGLLIVLVVLAVLVVGSGVTLALRNTGGDKVPAASDTPTTAPSETPSQTPSATPSESSTPGAPPSVDEIVTTSRLYTVGVLSPTQCLEPKAIPTTITGTKAYYGLILPCLNRTWWLAMKKASLPYRAPKLVVFTGPMKTICGAEKGNRAFYCGTNETIYMPYALGAAYYARNPISGRVWMMNTLAHEYGHHVQKLSGIYAASLSRQINAATPADQLTESRRRELQASCFGSAYLGAAGPYIPLRGPLLTTWTQLVANTGDEFSRPRVHDHGNRANHSRWSLAGFNTKSPNVCNTFVASRLRTN
nr:neutral zinc metallopeptidase [Streptomyces sp. SID13031]